MLDGGPDRSVSNNQFSSVTLNELETKARDCNFKFNKAFKLIEVTILNFDRGMLGKLLGCWITLNFNAIIL